MVTAAPADTVMVLLSNATFCAVKLIVTGVPVTVEEVVVVLAAVVEVVVTTDVVVVVVMAIVVVVVVVVDDGGADDVGTATNQTPARP